MSTDFPPEIDLEFYKQKYGIKDDVAAIRDYAPGIAAGKMCSRLCARDEFLKYLSDRFKNKRILEIGPGHTPAFTGENVVYFDVCDREQLIERSKRYNLPVNHVPTKIHYVDPHGDLRVVKEKFDLVFSSHQIEHSVDIIEYFNNIRYLLHDEGVFACIAPDKRFTFDHFRPLSTFEEAVDQHFNRPGYNHPIQNWLYQLSNKTHNDSKKHWGGEHGTPRGYDYSRLCCDLNAYRHTTKLIEQHRWIFTADTFRDLCNALKERGLISLELRRLYNVPLNANGFNAIFTPTPSRMVRGSPTQTQKPCNICGYTEYRTGPLGRRSRGGYLPDCMFCHSLERHRAARTVWDVLRPHMAGLKALQFSPEPTIPPNYFREFEVSEYGGANHLDLENIDRPDASYDIVLCNHVLEHVGDDNRALHEMLRIVRYDGICEIAVPIYLDRDTEDWGYADEKQHGHYRVYGRDIWNRLKGQFYLLEVQAKDPVTDAEDLMFFLTRSKETCRTLHSLLYRHFPTRWRYIETFPAVVPEDFDPFIQEVSSLAGKEVAHMTQHVLGHRSDLVEICVNKPGGPERMLLWLWQYGREEESIVKSYMPHLETALSWLHAAPVDKSQPDYSRLIHMIAVALDLNNDTREDRARLAAWFNAEGKQELDLADILGNGPFPIL